VAASALGLIGLFNAVGTYMFGLLGARYSQKHLLALIYLLRTLIIVVFLLAPISAASTLVFAAAMDSCARRRAPRHRDHRPGVRLTHFNTLYGIVFLSHQVGSFFGAWMGGVVFRPLRQLRLRLGRADRDRRRRLHPAVADGRAPAARAPSAGALHRRPP